MNIYGLHRRLGRAPSRTSETTHRGAPAIRVRARLETSEPAGRYWSIPNLSNSETGSRERVDWRRRVLAARGRQIHNTSVERGDRCAIAILDPSGIVIAWHDHLPHARAHDPDVLRRHMSQFYLADDIALNVPGRHLSIAAEYGVDTQRGWRRRPGGEIFWGVTVMQSILLADGELLGYSHVTRSLHAPARQLYRSVRPAQPRGANLTATA